MATPHDILRYLADLAPVGGRSYDVVTRRSEFVYLGWQPLLVDPALPSGTLRQTRHRDLRRLASIDALHSGERLLRIGWLFLAGTIDVDGTSTQFCLPLLSAPIRLRGTLNHRIIHEGDMEMPDGLFDDEARELLEDSSDPYGGGALPEGRGLLQRMPRFQAWVKEAAVRAGLPAPRIAELEDDPAALRSQPELHLAPGAAVYTVRDTVAPNVRGTLLGWTSAALEGTAFAAMYGDPAPGPLQPPASIETPFALNARQREALHRSRAETITVVSGPPGTGKSHLVAAAAVDEVGRGNSVLIATQSPHASDVIADLLDRYPGPRHIRFGRSEHRRSAADELSEGMAQPYPDGDVERIEERLRHTHDRVEQVRAVILGALGREAAFADGLARRGALSLMTAQAPGILDANVTITDAERLLERSQSRTGFLAAWRRSRAEVRLRRLLRARADATMDQIAAAVEAGRAEHAVQSGLADGGLKLGAVWSQFEEAQAAWRLAVGEAIEARRRARRNSHRASRRAVAALASALRSGRSERRRILRDLSGEHFLDVLPLWLGTLTEIDDTLPVVPHMFDVVIFDEASQIDQMRAAPALARARRAIVVGDPKQLRHVSFVADEDVRAAAQRHRISGDVGRMLDVRRNSLFDAAAGAAPVTWLDEHFRSVPHIIAFSDRTFYDGRLRLMTQHPATETRDAIRVRRVAGSRSASGVNRVEIDTVIDEVRSAQSAGASSIGVVTPFRAQADALEEALLAAFSVEEVERLGLATGTVHAFQGNERNVVIVSLALAAEDLSRSRRFVEDPNLFNVLVTRARSQMIVVTSLGEGDVPAGLLREYLRHADHPPLPSESSRPPSGWHADLAVELGRYALPVTAHYPVAGWEIDLVMGEGGSAIGVECGVHPQGPEAHIERHGALRRAGWEITDCFQSRWLTQPDEAAASLAAQLLGTKHP